MYIIIDWMLFTFVTNPDTWNSKEEAETYGNEELQNGLWEVIPIPPQALAYLSDYMV